MLNLRFMKVICMLKKNLVFALALVITSAFLFSCGSSSSRTSNVKKVIESQVSVSETASKEVVSNNSSLKKTEVPETSAKENVRVDLDLTEYTSVVADAYLKQLQDNMDKYRGVVVKAKGEYSHFKDPNSGNDYYNCVFSSACCPNGLEFVLKDGKYPTEEGKNITVVGEFNYYEEDGVVYFNLINAELV